MGRYAMSHLRRVLVGKVALAALTLFAGATGVKAHDTDHGEGGGKSNYTQPGPGGSAHPGPYLSQGFNLLGHLSLQDMSKGILGAGGTVVRNASGIIGSALWGWADPVTGREFAIYGKSNATSFVEVTNPLQPRYIGDLPTQTGISDWREMQVYQKPDATGRMHGYAYIGSDINGNHGVQIFDLNRLLDPGLAAADPLGLGTTFTADGLWNGVASLHTIHINQTTGFAYLNGSNLVKGGPVVVDLKADPLNPTLVGSYESLWYAHDSTSVIYQGADARFLGKEIAFVFQGGALSIADMTNKASITSLFKGIYPGQAYVHQGGVTEDHRFLLINDEFDELNSNLTTRTHLYDLTSLTNPFYLGAFNLGTTSTDHNLFIKGNYVLESNYTTGLRAFSLENLPTVAAAIRAAKQSNPNADVSALLAQALVPQGWFDTSPPNDNRGFDGSWGNYPYLPSGNVLITDRQNGLFVVRPTNFSLAASVAAPEPGSAALLLFLGCCSGALSRRKRLLEGYTRVVGGRGAEGKQESRR